MSCNRLPQLVLQNFTKRRKSKKTHEETDEQPNVVNFYESYMRALSIDKIFHEAQNIVFIMFIQF